MAIVLMSADIAITDPCVVFALRRESMRFRRDHPFQQRFPGAPCRAHFRGPADRTVLMLETGLGVSAMETALRWCLSAPRFGEVLYRPRFVLSVGFSGALGPNQRVGDLILATEVIDSTGARWPATVPASASLQGVCRSRIMTATELVGDPVEKQRLGQRYEAVAVDMESSVVARLCHERGVPFVCLRVISDDWTTPLSPRLVELLRRSRVSPPRLLGAVLRQPGMIAELWRLAKQTREAADKLSVLNTLLLEWRK